MGKAMLVVRLVEVDGTADLRMHLRAAKLFGADHLSNRRSHQCRAREIEAAPLGHEEFVRQDGKIRPTRDAVPMIAEY